MGSSSSATMGRDDASSVAGSASLAAAVPVFASVRWAQLLAPRVERDGDAPRGERVRRAWRRGRRAA